jgi:hypothetical protein
MAMYIHAGNSSYKVVEEYSGIRPAMWVKIPD